MDSLLIKDELCIKRVPYETIINNKLSDTCSTEEFVQVNNLIDCSQRISHTNSTEIKYQYDAQNEIQICPDITAIYVKCDDDMKVTKNYTIFKNESPDFSENICIKMDINEYEVYKNKLSTDSEIVALRNIQCYHCGKLCTTKTMLKRHIKINENKCCICNLNFAFECEFKKHLKIHSSESHYCITCNNKFTFNDDDVLKNVDLLRCGTCTLKSDELFVCKYCDVKFTQRRFLSAHLKSHQNEKSFLCDLCNQRFSNLQHVKRHIQVIHNGATSYECIHCKKCFRWDSSLRTHLKTHTNERPHQCACCSYSFRRSCDLRRHMITHTNEKNYSCKHCDKRFTRNSSLQRHVRAHFGEKPYLCSVCGKRFNESFFLKEHMESHSENRLYYYCDRCDKRFNNRRILRMHTKKHTKDNSKTELLLPEMNTIPMDQLTTPDSFFGILPRQIWE